MLMAFSAADLTILRIRCPECGQHTEKLVSVLVKKSNIPCNVCGATIDLESPANQLLIKETAQSCARIGAALMAQVTQS
jgi:transcription elongation factor Elf1